MGSSAMNSKPEQTTVTLNHKLPENYLAEVIHYISIFSTTLTRYAATKQGYQNENSFPSNGYTLQNPDAKIP